MVFIDFFSFINEFRLDEGIVQFNKGSMYAFGGGLCFLLLTAIVVIKGVLNKELTMKREISFTKWLIFSAVLVLFLPHVMHFSVSKYAGSHNYSVCDDASVRVRIYTEIYYTKTEQDCNQAVQDSL